MAKDRGAIGGLLDLAGGAFNFLTSPSEGEAARIAGVQITIDAKRRETLHKELFRIADLQLDPAESAQRFNDVQASLGVTNRVNTQKFFESQKKRKSIGAQLPITKTVSDFGGVQVTREAPGEEATGRTPEEASRLALSTDPSLSIKIPLEGGGEITKKAEDVEPTKPLTPDEEIDKLRLDLFKEFPSLFKKLVFKGTSEEGKGLTTKEQAALSSTFRKEFNALSADFRKIRDSFERIKVAANDPSAAGDLAIIFNFMKILDPGSVVRESEFATAANSAGVPDQIRNLWNKALTGERIAFNRDDFVNQARNLFGAQQETQNKLAERYTGIAERFGVNPENVVTFTEEQQVLTATNPQTGERRQSLDGGKTWQPIQ